MPRSKSRAKKAARPASPPSAALAAVEEQEEHPADLPPPDEPAAAAAADLITESEAEEAEDARGRKRAASRVGTNFSEDEKDLIIEFLQKNPYSRRLAGYKESAIEERLWPEQARVMNRSSNELQTVVSRFDVVLSICLKYYYTGWAKKNWTIFESL